MKKPFEQFWKTVFEAKNPLPQYFKTDYPRPENLNQQKLHSINADYTEVYPQSHRGKSSYYYHQETSDQNNFINQNQNEFPLFDFSSQFNFPQSFQFEEELEAMNSF